MASSSRRALLAALWSIVGLLTLTSFVIAIVFAYASKNYAQGEQQGGSEDWERQQQAQGSAISVTPRAMVFAAIWTAVLSGILVIYGTVILGIRMPTGKYYACCAGNVHRMTPLSLGAFGGSLLMFANLTLVCAILFGEFEVRLQCAFDVVAGTSPLTISPFDQMMLGLYTCHVHVIMHRSGTSTSAQ